MPYARHDLVRDINRIRPRFFGDAHSDRRIFAKHRVFHRRIVCGLSIPNIMRRWRRAIAHVRHIAQIHRFAVRYADDQLADFLRILQIRAGFHRHGLIASEQLANRHADVGRLQSLTNFIHAHATGGHAHRVQLDHDRTPRPADGFHFARAIDAFEFSFQALCHTFEFACVGLRIFVVQRQRDDRYVVNAFGLDDRRHHAQPLRQPVAVGIERVVQTNQCFGARHADFVLHRHHRHTGARHGHDVLDAGDLPEHLLGRCRHHALDILSRCAGKRNQYVRHGDVDLRFFFARRDQHGENPQQQRDQRQQRRNLRILEKCGDATGYAHFVIGFRGFRRWRVHFCLTHGDSF